MATPGRFTAGTLVLVNSEDEPEINGSYGKVTMFNSFINTYVVKLMGENKARFFKPEQVVLPPPAGPSGQLEPNPVKQEKQEMLPPPAGPSGLLELNPVKQEMPPPPAGPSGLLEPNQVKQEKQEKPTSFAVGDRVRLDDGTEGVVDMFNQLFKFYIIRLANDDTLTVKADKLTLVQSDSREKPGISFGTSMREPQSLGKTPGGAGMGGYGAAAPLPVAPATSFGVAGMGGFGAAAPLPVAPATTFGVAGMGGFGAAAPLPVAPATSFGVAGMGGYGAAAPLPVAPAVSPVLTPAVTLAAATPAPAGGTTAAPATPANEESTSGDLKATAEDQGITAEEVAKHSTMGDAWMILHGEVYDVSVWAKKHPGGPWTVLAHAGKDASSIYDAKHNAKGGMRLLGKYKVPKLGKLQE